MDGRSRIARVRVGDQFADEFDNVVQYFIQDVLSSVTVTLSDTGALLSKQEYYPFGETAYGSYSKKRYMFTGKEKDDCSGLYYYGARFYAPWTCKFISVDPIYNPAESPYVYASNNPIGNNDPTGMQTDGAQQRNYVETDSGGGESSGSKPTGTGGHFQEQHGGEGLEASAASWNETFNDTQGNTGVSITATQTPDYTMEVYARQDRITESEAQPIGSEGYNKRLESMQSANDGADMLSSSQATMGPAKEQYLAPRDRVRKKLADEYNNKYAEEISEGRTQARTLDFYPTPSQFGWNVLESMVPIPTTREGRGLGSVGEVLLRGCLNFRLGI